MRVEAETTACECVCVLLFCLKPIAKEDISTGWADGSDIIGLHRNHSAKSKSQWLDDGCSELCLATRLHFKVGVRQEATLGENKWHNMMLEETRGLSDTRMVKA